MNRPLLVTLLAAGWIQLTGCASLESDALAPGVTMRETTASASEVTYEYAVLQIPDLLPTTAREAERHCRGQGASATEFHRWGGSPISNFVTYRCVKRTAAG